MSIRRAGRHLFQASRVPAVLAGLLLLCCPVSGSIALADGLLPPAPYHYLHPPKALANGNNPPTPGEIGAALRQGQQTNPVTLFTRDGQFGIDVDPGTFSGPPSATTVAVRIQPVETPPGLPNGVIGEGNAYAVSAAYLPSNSPAPSKQPFTIILRWPRLPKAIYVYQRGHWRVLCTPQQWAVSTATVSCRSAGLGTFVAVVHGRSTTSSGTSTLARYWWVIVVVCLVVLAAMIAFFVTRGRGGPPSGQRASLRR